MSNIDFLAPLTRIGDGVHLYEPSSPSSLPGDLALGDPAYNPSPNPDSNSDSDYRDPRLIILCTWLGGASAKNIARYVAGHRRLFRHASLLLVTTQLHEITVTPFRQMHERLRPARDVIVRHVLLAGNVFDDSSSSSSPSILWHIFSNGGLNTAIQLAHITRHKLFLDIGNAGTGAAKGKQGQGWMSTCPPAPAPALDAALGGVIMDCCPGDASLGRTFAAAAYSLPDTWAAQTVGRLLLLPAIAALLCAQAASSRLLGRAGSLGDLWRAAHDPAVLGDEHVARLYLYSVSDRLVPWRLVHRHMDEARGRGLAAVQGEAIPGGGHCALLRGDADLYWRAVAGFWIDIRRRWQEQHQHQHQQSQCLLLSRFGQEEQPPLEGDGKDGHDSGHVSEQRRDQVQEEQVPGPNTLLRSRL